MAPIPLETGSGPLREFVAFDRRIQIDDGYGNQVGDWEEQFRSAGGLVALTGGESVRASRLEGIQPYSLTVRWSATAATVTPDWRCRDVRSGKVFAIRTAVSRPGRNYIDFMIVEGEAP